jgi:serine/threonine protein kinase
MFKRKAKFTKKADLFAGGIVFLELVTLKDPKNLYDIEWPSIDRSAYCPTSMRAILASMLDADPAKRTSFADILPILKKGRAEIHPQIA